MNAATETTIRIALDIDHAAKDAREDTRANRGQYVDFSNTCFCCGRKAGSHWVAIDLRDSTAVDVAFAEAEGGMDTAFFPVGSTCRRALSIPKACILSRRDLFGA